MEPPAASCVMWLWWPGSGARRVRRASLRVVCVCVCDVIHEQGCVDETNSFTCVSCDSVMVTDVAGRWWMHHRVTSVAGRAAPRWKREREKKPKALWQHQQHALSSVCTDY